jgi:hypothetical protein
VWPESDLDDPVNTNGGDLLDGGRYLLASAVDT